jgi:dGTPase
LARLGAGANAKAIRSAAKYTINHSSEMADEVGEIWKKLQVARLHTDQRVEAANLKASGIVAELTLAYAIKPQLVDSRFMAEHKRLWGTAYMKFYRDRGGSEVTIPRAMYAFMPLHVMIGTDHPLSVDVKLPVEQLIAAKDYVASLSDSRSRIFHADLLSRQ